MMLTCECLKKKSVTNKHNRQWNSYLHGTTNATPFDISGIVLTHTGYQMKCKLTAPTLQLLDKDGKAFHPTYEEKLRLVALHKQVLLGPYNPDASPEVGFFDVLGNDRR